MKKNSLSLRIDLVIFKKMAHLFKDNSFVQKKESQTLGQKSKSLS